MKKLIINLITQIGTFATLLGLIYTLKGNANNFSVLQIIFLSISILLFIVSIVIIFSDYYKTKPKIFSSKEKIKDYMFNWINNSGRTLIFTRDLSWVDDKTKRLLKTKSRNNELIICVPKKVALIEEFEQDGAQIIEYSSCEHTPQSRFTITNFGRADAKIAVGHPTSKIGHLIEEFNNGEHPFFFVADDLVKVLANYNNIKL